MPEPSCLAEWTHHDCQVGFRASAPPHLRYVIRHRSGYPMGCAANLDEARELIDDQILLMRQRLAASA
ncbi:hypothetical protein KBY58_09155 [Cyanobium sp. HWJ4-Hawea]|uniref:hypothetical protein n=1 Tax=unclassified Cyanobium TaxID=2627006 RepID=UPI0020CDE2E4|nr:MULTISPECIES: hypothetical protein [unclassified Cyanobium]MCP9774520.1 hypothetical protein [Cyanobium sp. WAJ14-Wanaka]MCP9809598.1 hypothetical protein [Cyanobium sp. HWJ4-Hawea]